MFERKKMVLQNKVAFLPEYRNVFSLLYTRDSAFAVWVYFDLSKGDLMRQLVLSYFNASFRSSLLSISESGQIY